MEETTLTDAAQLK